LPRCVVFDLDGCMWHPAMQSLWAGDGSLAVHLAWPDFGGAPFVRQEDGALRDRRGERVALFPGARRALRELASGPWASVAVGIASCSTSPSWAHACLRTFRLDDGRPLSEVFSAVEIRRGSKQSHLRSIVAKIGCKFDEVLFFDNEPGHCAQVAEIGATSVLCPLGLSEHIWTGAQRAFPAPGKVIALHLSQ